MSPNIFESNKSDGDIVNLAIIQPSTDPFKKFDNDYLNDIEQEFVSLSSQAAEKAAADGMARGLTTIEVMIKGPGGGREAAVRALMASGLKVTGLMDLTPIPHNGCRPPKRRRV